MNNLNRQTADVKAYPTKIIQFGEGNFLRAFVDWIIWNTNQKTDFNAGVVVVQPIEKGLVDVLNQQDGLYHVNLQGMDKGIAVDSIQMIDVINGGLNPYTQNDEFMALAENPDIRFVISNTTENVTAVEVKDDEWLCPNCNHANSNDKASCYYCGAIKEIVMYQQKMYGR